MKLPRLPLRLSNQGLGNDKGKTMFKLLKTKMITWNSHHAAVTPAETRPQVTRAEITALFAAELGGHARRC